MAEDNDAIWLHAQQRITIVELAEISGLREDVLHELVEVGALTPVDALTGHFSARCVGTVRTAARLYNDLELETPALAVMLSFLDRIEALQSEVRALNAQLARPRR
jgi:chaperone modulatory protein CbpM